MTTFLRRPARIAFAAAALLLSIFLPAHAQVTQMTTLGGEVRAFLARSGTEVYAAAYGGGLYRSTDAGVNWTRLALPGNARYLTSIAGNATAALRVVGSDEGLFTSTDGVNFTQRLDEPVSAVAVAPGGGTPAFIAGIKGLGIMRSIDGGVNFSIANNAGFTGTDIIALAEHPGNASIFYASVKPDGQGNRGGIFKSSDAGQSWAGTGAFPDAGIANVFGLAVDTSGNLHAAALRTDGDGYVYKLTGGVGAWNSYAGHSNNTYGAVSVHRDANTGTTIWAGHVNLGLRRSVGGGGFNDAAQNNGPAPSPLYTAITAVATLPGGGTTALMAVKGTGIWRSTNPGVVNWARVSGFANADRVLSATATPGNATPMLVGLHAGGVWRSDAPGNASTTFNPPTINAGQADFTTVTNPAACNTGTACTTAVNAFTSVWDLNASSSSNIYAAVGNVGMHYLNDNAGLFRYNGSVWQGINGASSAGAPWNIVQEAGFVSSGQPIYSATINNGDSSMVYAGFLGATNLQRRTAGPSWAGGLGGVVTPIRAVFASNALHARVIAMPFGDKPLLSTSFGASFATVSVSQTGFSHLNFYQIAENPATGALVGASNKGIFYSSDGGNTWTRSTSAAFLQQAVTAVGFKPTGRFFAADWAGNRYCSADAGVNWTRLITGVASFNSGVNAIRTMNGEIYYLTDGAGFFRELGSC